jgi:hypothetical protein
VLKEELIEPVDGSHSDRSEDYRTGSQVGQVVIDRPQKLPVDPCIGRFIEVFVGFRGFYCFTIDLNLKDGFGEIDPQDADFTSEYPKRCGPFPG